MPSPSSPSSRPSPSSSPYFAKRESIEQVEEGLELAPKFNKEGLIPVITSDEKTGDVLMHGYMNEEALKLSIKTAQAYYYSRSRKQIWHKGAKSGLIQNIIEMRIDDDQDSIWLRVKVAKSGASCHVGYRSCFYRSVPLGKTQTSKDIVLRFEENEKIFDPKEVYGDVPNPTKL